MSERGWHPLTAAEVLAEREAGSDRLTRDEAVPRLASHGRNRLTPAR